MPSQEAALLVQLTRRDGVYQTLLADCLALETEYRRILEQLSPEDRTLLERYITLCEELEYRRTEIALQTRMDSLI